MTTIDMQQIAAKVAARKIKLSHGQLEIVEMVCDGQPNKRICYRLSMTQRMLTEHLNDLYKRTATGNRVRLAVWCAKQGIV